MKQLTNDIYMRKRAEIYDVVQRLYFGGQPTSPDAGTWYSMRAISLALGISKHQVRTIV